jgi:N-acetyl-gamma-glutamyl-phosphate/LysW-gamma-L-alpha-aminoadipyl-6-phosphate reductase
VRSYKPTGHRHTAEVEQELSRLTNQNVRVQFTATSIELVRGILVTAHVFLKEDLTEAQLWQTYREVYEQEPFIRLINDKMGMYRMPEPKLLAGTNFCDLGLQKDASSNRVVVIGAIDNLGKGTAGQAVQAMNIRHNWPETLGLEFSGLHPI